jgi:fucose permease
MTTACHIIAYTVASIHPPFPALVTIFVLAGFGNGLQDAAWNAWVGNMAHVNEILGVLHSFYGLGATVSPLIATSMITKANLPWYSFYYVMIGFSVIELCAIVPAFWKATGSEFREKHPRKDGSKGAPIKEAMFTMPAARTTWICTAFLFTYMGVEVALGGWIVTFMLTVRDASPFASGMAATGFWLGMTIGRVTLGFVTPRIGEKRSVFVRLFCTPFHTPRLISNTQIYIGITMALELLFWLVPQFYVSVVAVGLEGFFIGPLFPAAVLAATRILPRHLHVFAIGFAAAAGGAGASVFPFMVGAIAQTSSKGVEVLQPVVLACLAGLFVLWLGLPRMEKKQD